MTNDKWFNYLLHKCLLYFLPQNNSPNCTLCTLNTVTFHLFSIYALFVSFIFASKHLAPKNNSSNFGSNCNNTYHGISIENVKYKTNISYHVFRLIFQKSIHQSLSTRYFSHLPPQNKKQVSSC